MDILALEFVLRVINVNNYAGSGGSVVDRKRCRVCITIDKNHNS